ncbi:MAG TPA: molybdopterin biosynthesis protein [Candidatus Caldiarchaeum subterraneum]|uniref:Molybdopterin biosynthesis protein n=1 Tax=Caldiarchaeum subterraneum TaxID=311458 RepID=A0A832ZYQ3_CALS0|nr:molybdopterin biosynthesis protein [Candidatus Caldarchaeum subterraneum]
MALVFHALVSLGEALDSIEKRLGGIKPLGEEEVGLLDALGRVAAEDMKARISSPPFDRSTVDGYAVRASDTYEASEETPVTLKIVGKAEIGSIPNLQINHGECVEISTGAPIPRGANAVVMVEYTKQLESGRVMIYKPVAPGDNVAQAGTDISVGDVIVRKGHRITPREIAVLTAAGYDKVKVYRKPRVAVFSTGDELVESGKPLKEGMIYDVNGPAIVSMLLELGVEASFMGILRDDYLEMKKKIEQSIASGYDIVITSGSTSAGFGDMIYKIFNEVSGGGVIVHGLKIKPGKPTVLAISGKKILIGLPGFPLSAMMVFLTLVKPMVTRMLGLGEEDFKTVKASFPFRLEAGRGKLELIPVQLLEGAKGLTAYPLIGQSGSTSLLALADGLVEVNENREFIEENEQVEVKLLSGMIKPAELTIVGSHCPAVDILLNMLNLHSVKVINVGSLGGWYSVKRGEADIAGTHLLDEKTGEYNVFMLDKMNLRNKARLIRGYARRIGFVVKSGNPKNITSFKDLLRDDVIFVNRIRGSGIRTLTDIKLKEVLEGEDPVRHIKGYDYEVRTHSAVAAAVKHGRADVGITIEAMADMYNLDFIPVTEEIYDFLIQEEKMEKKQVKDFLNILRSLRFSEELGKSLKGYRVLPETGQVIG